MASDATTDRFSFKIQMDEYVKNQTLLGLDKFVLNNCISDATYLKEYLSYDMLSYIAVSYTHLPAIVRVLSHFHHKAWVQ